MVWYSNSIWIRTKFSPLFRPPFECWTSIRMVVWIPDYHINTGHLKTRKCSLFRSSLYKQAFVEIASQPILVTHCIGYFFSFYTYPFCYFNFLLVFRPHSIDLLFHRPFCYFYLVASFLLIALICYFTALSFCSLHFFSSFCFNFFGWLFFGSFETRSSCPGNQMNLIYEGHSQTSLVLVMADLQSLNRMPSKNDLTPKNWMKVNFV